MPGPQILYQVVASIQSREDLDAYLAWLRGGHIADVVAGGALRGRVAVHEGDGAYEVLCSYDFEDAQAFARYEAGPAQALRAEGIALFGPDSGRRLAWTRFVGRVDCAVAADRAM